MTYFLLAFLQTALWTGQWALRHQEKNDGEVWDLLRELPELVVAARDAAPEEKRSAYEPVINALVAASGFALERGAPVEDLGGWVDATLGRLLPVVDRSAQLSAGYALYKLGLTPHGRSALLEGGTFAKICDALADQVGTSVLHP